jgi:hypothetical protein
LRLTYDQVVAGLEQRGVPKHVAEGVAMNFQDESGFDTSIVGDNGNAVGLAQWNGDRMRALKSFAAERGKSFDDGDLQLDYFMHENSGREAGAWAQVMAAGSKEEAAVAFVNHWERPAETHRAARAAKYSGGQFKVSDLPASDTLSGTTTPLGSEFAMPDLSFEVRPDTNTIDDDPGYIQLAKDAFFTTNSLGAIFEGAPAGKYDPNFQMTEEDLKGYLKDLDQERYAPWFQSATSAENALAIREAALANQERSVRLEQAGLKGAALTMTAALLDPVAIGAGLLTEGAGTALISGAKLSKASWLLYNTALGGASGAAGVAATAPFVDGVDGSSIASGAILGGVLGTAVGALSRNPAMFDEMVRFRDAVRDHNLASTGLLAEGGGGGSVGAAAATGTIEDFLKTTQLAQIQDHEVPKTFAAALRGGWGLFDTAGALRSSKNPLTRWLGTNLTKDAADPTVMTATEEKSKFFDLWNRAFYSVYNPSLKSWFKDNAGSSADDFNVEVSRFVRDRSLMAEENYHASVVQVGRRLRELHNEIRKLANNPFLMEGQVGRSVKGFEDLEENPFYMMRAYDALRVKGARDAYGDDGVASAFEQAMQAANPRVPVKPRRAAAKAFARAVVKRAHDVDSDAARILGTENLEEVLDILKTEGGLSDDDAKALLSSYRVRKNSEAPARGKHRLLLDETAKIKLTDRHTGEVTESSIADLLLVNDANHLWGKYAHQMSGRVAMARLRLKDPKTEEILVDGITSDLEANRLINEIDKRGADMGLSMKQRDFDKNRFEYLFGYLAGRPTGQIKNQAVEDWVRAFEKFNYVRVMNQAGFAQLPELAGVITTGGLKAFLTHMPSFRRLVDGTGESRLINEAAHDMETFIAYGVERMTHGDYRQMNELAGNVASLDRGRLVDKVDVGLSKMSRWTSDISGMNMVNIALQRAASMTMVQKFVDMAHGGAFKLGKARLASLGLDEKMTERIFKELANPNNVETVRGALTSRKIKKLNFDRWTDLEAREAFRNALYRSTRQMIQHNDIGMLAQWMSHPIGRVLVQFRRFIFGSFTNHLLYNANLLRKGDMRALSFFLTSTLFSGLSYSLWQQIKTIGMPNRQEVLEKRLAPTELAKAAFSRSGYSSILPMLMDSGLSQAITGSQQFDYRTSGQPADALFGNPTTGFVNDFQSALNAITHPLLNQRGMTQKEVRDFTRIFPFANALPAVITVNSLTQGLDERPPRSDFEE